MFRKLAFNNITSLISLILIAVLLTFYIYLSLSINSKLSLINDLNKISNTADFKTLSFRQYIVLGLIIIFTFYLVALIKSYNKIIKLKEKIILMQKEEIEKQKEMIENITFKYKNAAESDKLKTEFFSSISHELKTPISIILGAIQLINQSKPSHIIEDRRTNKHFEAIKHNCYRLLRLINNILDISKIDSGYIKINLVNCNIVCLVEEMTQSVAPYARNREISIEFDTEDEEIFTSVDIDKMERIILNLLSNAIKFTPPGGFIKVKVGKANDNVYVSIKDTGLGIPKNMQKIIFERFKQVNSSLTKDFEGSGIGLSLVKSFVSLHKGNIKLMSEENNGSEFIVELPIFICENNYIDCSYIENSHNKIIEAINIEFSDIYSLENKNAC